MVEPIRCLEFFSGIGGLHYALNMSETNAIVVAAFDVNEVANKVYKHNFKKDPSKKTIDRLTAMDIEKYSADCWLMSPPCQPYTQGGNMKDVDDPRSKALIHLINLLPLLSRPPSYVFLENVKNFEGSQSREKLVQQLGSLGYDIHECLLSPVQFGIPNHRLRYYLTARLCKNNARTSSDYLAQSHIHTTWPFSDVAQFNPSALASFLQDTANEDDAYKVPSKHILRLHNFRLDIVGPSSTKTSCITKAYGSHHIMTSGSLVKTKQMHLTEYRWEDPSSLLSFGLRFLTPTEVARLHAFPLPTYWPDEKHDTLPSKYRAFKAPTCLPHLEFPNDVTQNQRYRLLGNSLNCWVVSELYRCILFQSQANEEEPRQHNV